MTHTPLPCPLLTALARHACSFGVGGEQHRQQARPYPPHRVSQGSAAQGRGKDEPTSRRIVWAASPAGTKQGLCAHASASLWLVHALACTRAQPAAHAQENACQPPPGLYIVHRPGRHAIHPSTPCMNVL